jgi:hypothetical protein
MSSTPKAARGALADRTGSAELGVERRAVDVVPTDVRRLGIRQRIWIRSADTLCHGSILGRVEQGFEVLNESSVPLLRVSWHEGPEHTHRSVERPVHVTREERAAVGVGG